MESAVKANGIANEIGFSKSLLNEHNGSNAGTIITVQQALCKWYTLFSQQVNSEIVNGFIFPELQQDKLLNSLQTDIELIPSVLMEEFISNSLIQDKEQYIRLVQALLINLSDCLYENQNEFTTVFSKIENTIQFLHSFFYQQFDADSRLTKYCLQQFFECAKLKIEYWKIKLNNSPLLVTLEECLADKFISAETIITYRKINYIKYLLEQIESATTVISEKYVREIFLYNNFNAECFINYEIGLIEREMKNFQTNRDAILFLQSDYVRLSQLKIKAGIYFDSKQPSVKKQLLDWVVDKIKQVEVTDKKANDKDLQIDSESKIQTSLSVAKLAVLIRLMVVDKIIINKSVAPMLRTVTKLFTTLQKDEISFGSMETKYHAPDKATLNTMKEILGKWVSILGKL
jgi:hypothetical protein